MRYLIISLGLVLAVRSALADPLTPFSGEGKEVTLADVLPHFDLPENKNNEFYSEWWSFAFFLEDKYWAYVQFVISNMGPGDGKAAVTAEVSLPDGQKFSDRSEYELGKWSYSKDKFELKFGENSIIGPIENMTINIKNSSFEAVYRLNNICPPYKPGNGRVQYGASSSRYYEFHIIAPSARIEGEIRVSGDDQVHKVKGLIYADHSVSSIGMHEQAKRWARFRSVSDKTTFIMANIETPDVYGGVPIQFAVLFHEGKKVFEATSFEVKPSKIYMDEKKQGYSVPQILILKGQNFTGAIQASKLTEREDFIESAGPGKAFIVSKYAKPVMYYFDASYAIKVPGGAKVTEYKGKGRYYYTVVNP